MGGTVPRQVALGCVRKLSMSWGELASGISPWDALSHDGYYLYLKSIDAIIEGPSKTRSVGL